MYLLLAALMGLAFGWFLERAGFGSAKKLTAVFTMRDWQVYKVMFTAILTAMIGAQILGAVGILDLGALELSSTYLWPMFLGGILFGIGFYFGGFCPGTAVVSMVRGRLDGLFFLVGIVLGIYGFALFLDGPGQASWFQSFYLPSSARVMSLVESPYAWVWAIGITAAVLASFRYLYIFEQRFSLRTPQELASAKPRPAPVKPPMGQATKVALGLTAVAAVILAVVQVGRHEPEVLAIASEVAAPVAVDEAAVPAVDPLSLAEWIVADSHRIADEKPQNSHTVDIRPEEERTAVPVRGAIAVHRYDDTGQQYDAVVDALDEVLTPADKNKPLVIVDDGDSTLGRDLVAQLREDGLNAMLLDGGSEAWQETILSADAIWPEWVVGADADADTPLAPPSVAAYHDEVAAWMLGEAGSAPAYVAIPGTVQLPSEAATVVATGGGGGGCG